MSELKRAAFFGIGEGVRTPVDSPTYFGLSSQPEKLGPRRPGTEMLDDNGDGLGWILSTFSTLSSATCASRTRFLFIKFSNICKALSNRIPGRRPRWNLKARVIANAAIITMTAMSTVVKASWGNLVS